MFVCVYCSKLGKKLRDLGCSRQARRQTTFGNDDNIQGKTKQELLVTDLCYQTTGVIVKFCVYKRWNETTNEHYKRHFTRL